MWAHTDGTKRLELQVQSKVTASWAPLRTATRGCPVAVSLTQLLSSKWLSVSQQDSSTYWGVWRVPRGPRAQLWNPLPSACPCPSCVLFSGHSPGSEWWCLTHCATSLLLPVFSFTWWVGGCWLGVVSEVCVSVLFLVVLWTFRRQGQKVLSPPSCITFINNTNFKNT